MQHTAPIQLLQMTATSLVIYNQYKYRNIRTRKELVNEENLTRGKFNGYLSDKSKRAISKHLNNWLHALDIAQKRLPIRPGQKRRRPTFITLTLPSQQTHSDNEIKRRALMPFIQKLQRTTQMKHYFWMSETQKNGNIHFHLIVDTYIHHGQVRGIWNACLIPLGYIEAFKLKHGHTNPNSTDIKAVADFTTATKYVVKYIEKSNNCRPIEGRLHGMSDGLRDIKAFTTVLDNNTYSMIDEFVNAPGARVFSDDFFTVIYVNNLDFINKSTNELAREYRDYLTDVYRSLYENEKSIKLKVLDHFTQIYPELQNDLPDPFFIPREIVTVPTLELF